MPRRFEIQKAKAEDIQAAVEWMATRAQADPSRISVVGFCQGSNWAVEACVANPLVKAVALVVGHYLMAETTSTGTWENGLGFASLTPFFRFISST